MRHLNRGERNIGAEAALNTEDDHLKKTLMRMVIMIMMMMISIDSITMEEEEWQTTVVLNPKDDQ